MNNNINDKEEVNNDNKNDQNNNNNESTLEKNEQKKEDEFTLKEYLDNVNKELLVISNFEQNEQVKKCTYEKGYFTQEIYVCLTCSREKNTFSGICVGCAFKCHENHEVENLHFKRNFRCDCGNSNFCNNNIYIIFLKIKNLFLSIKIKF